MTDDLTAQGRRDTRRLTTVVTLGVGAVATAIAALVLWLGTPRPPTGSAPEANGEPTVRFTPPPSGGPGPVAATPISVTIPNDLNWAEVAGVSLPQSGTAGPRDRSAGLARGFSHDPMGAVLAAANIVIRINPQVGPDVFGPTLRDQVVGPDTGVLKENVERAYDQLRDQLGVAYGKPVGRIFATIRGFRVEQYSETDVWVRLLSEGPDGKGSTTLGAMLLELSWAGSDWAMVAPVGGTFNQAVSAVSSTATYTQFAPR